MRYFCFCLLLLPALLAAQENKASYAEIPRFFRSLGYKVESTESDQVMTVHYGSQDACVAIIDLWSGPRREPRENDFGLMIFRTYHLDRHLSRQVVAAWRKGAAPGVGVFSRLNGEVGISIVGDGELVNLDPNL